MPLIIPFAIAIVVTAALIPLLLRWSSVIGLMDTPGPRKVHRVPVPRIGGIAMVAGILVATLVTGERSPQLTGLLVGVALLLVFGILDDRGDLDFRIKFLGQAAAAAACMAIGGVHFEVSRLELPGLAARWLSLPLTFVFLVGVTNAVNLADGLDGLAGGFALLCLAAIALVAGHGANHMVVAFALVEAGAILGFLRFNTHPARCFMGDSGSQVLGFSIGVLSILATQGEGTPVSAALPLLIVGVPILDTLNVMYLRIRARRSPFSADRNHLHHRLLALGLGHAESVAILYVLQAGAFLLAYFLRFESSLIIVLVYAAAGAAILGSLALLERTGWRIAGTDRLPLLSSLRALRRRPERALPAAHALRALAATALLGYALVVVTAAERMPVDVTALSAGLSALLLLGALRGSGAEAPWAERAAAYVGAVLLVYLDVTAGERSPALAIATWALVVGVTFAALAALLLDSRRRFEATAFDVLIVLLALVIPSLPGGVALEGARAAGITKGILLVYAVEMLHTVATRARARSGIAALVMAVVAVRGALFLLP